MCDVAYVVLREQVERRALAERQVAVVALAAGAKGVTMPDVAKILDAFDADLVAAPRRTDDRTARLLEVIGGRRVA